VLNQNMTINQPQGHTMEIPNDPDFDQILQMADRRSYRVMGFLSDKFRKPAWIVAIASIISAVATVVSAVAAVASVIHEYHKL
jgi:hypothetical protein